MRAAQLSLGQIRERLASDGVDVPLHRVKYAVDVARILPTGRVGILRTWPESAVPRVRAAIRRIEAKRGGHA